MRQTTFQRQLIGFIFLNAILFGHFSVFAQTKRPATGTSKTQTASNQTKTCNSGYTGTVNYTKTVTVNSTGKNGSFRNMKRVYKANVIVRDEGTPQGSVTASPDGGLNGSFNLYGRVESNQSEQDNRLDVSEKDEICSFTIKGAGKKQHMRCESKSNDQSEANGSGERANVFIGLRGRKLFLGITSLPRMQGRVSRTSSTNCSGTCSPFKPIGSSSEVETAFSSEQAVRTDENVIDFNPESFNRLSGSWTRTSVDGNTIENFQWNLSRCAPKLEIADIRFEHHVVPDAEKWRGIDAQKGTIDGNLVKIKARVFNNGGDTAYANVKFSETKSGEALPDAVISVSVKPGEYRDVEYEWDTTGYAWDENRKNQSEREIKAELEGGNTETAKIKILPKPIVMVHGLWANADGWAEYPMFLREAHSFAWKGYAVGSDPEHGKMSTGDSVGNYKPTNTIYQNAQELAKQVKFAREENNAWHIDLVAHSMGGLISRQYINTFMKPVHDNRPEVTHLVMLGTPNMGSPCADTVNEAFEETDNNEMHAMRELKPIIVRAFNTRVTDRKGVKFSVLIGIIPAPFTCLAKNVFGDGVVPIESAKWNLTDYEYAPREHTALTGREDFSGFVMPRIAIGPKKARAERNVAWLEDTLNTKDSDIFKSMFRNASFENQSNREIPQKENADPNVTARKKIVLAAKQTVEVEIPSSKSGENGVLLIANPGVVATLIDAATGEILGKIEGGREAMRNLFRMIWSGKKSTNALRLKLENFAAEETQAFVVGFDAKDGEDSSFTIEAGKPNATGTVSLTAKLFQANAPVLNARIGGRIVGDEKEIVFFDDGKHNDGAANDGVYGGTVEKLAKGEYFIEAQAEANNITRLAVAPLSIGNTATNAPIKNALKPRRGK